MQTGGPISKTDILFSRRKIGLVLPPCSSPPRRRSSLDCRPESDLCSILGTQTFALGQDCLKIWVKLSNFTSIEPSLFLSRIKHAITSYGLILVKNRLPLQDHNRRLKINGSSGIWYAFTEVFPHNLDNLYNSSLPIKSQEVLRLLGKLSDRRYTVQPKISWSGSCNRYYYGERSLPSKAKLTSSVWPSNSRPWCDNRH